MKHYIDRKTNEIYAYETNDTNIKEGLELLSDAELTQELQKKEDALPYDVKRQREYAQLNQFEMQFDDQVNGTTTWIDAINSIKAKYPKEGS